MKGKRNFYTEFHLKDGLRVEFTGEMMNACISEFCATWTILDVTN